MEEIDLVRQIIKIDKKKCNGCGLCANACHEGAIDIIDGKAKLVRENFCDGFGDCLPGCPTGAISFEEREAPAYDEAAVEAAKKGEERTMQNQMAENDTHTGCPGSRFMRFDRNSNDIPEKEQFHNEKVMPMYKPVSRLGQFPVQIKLLPTQAPFFDGAKLLIAADCTAYAYANMHEDFIKGHITLIGCPKLDEIDYTDKLTDIISNNGIKSVTVVRMEVPCCGGLQRAAENALKNSGKFIPWQVVTISRDGRILD